MKGRYDKAKEYREEYLKREDEEDDENI